MAIAAGLLCGILFSEWFIAFVACWVSGVIYCMLIPFFQPHLRATNRNIQSPPLITFYFEKFKNFLFIAVFFAYVGRLIAGLF